jgi:hypothetical protein
MLNVAKAPVAMEVLSRLVFTTPPFIVNVAVPPDVVPTARFPGPVIPSVPLETVKAPLLVFTTLKSPVAPEPLAKTGAFVKELLPMFTTVPALGTPLDQLDALKKSELTEPFQLVWATAT